MSKKRKLHQIKIVVPHSSIRLQLITGFLVPIIFIITETGEYDII